MAGGNKGREEGLTGDVGEVDSVQFRRWSDVKGVGGRSSRELKTYLWGERTNEFMKRKAERGPRPCPEGLVHAAFSPTEQDQSLVVSNHSALKDPPSGEKSP